MRARGAMLGLAMLAAALVAMAGCSREKMLVCSRSTNYLSAGSAGPIRVPDDLSVPDETEGLRIPEPLSGESAAVDNTDGCLEQSPAFTTPRSTS